MYHNKAIINVDNFDNPSDCTPTTSHTHLPGSAEGAISLESSIMQDLHIMDGCVSVIKQGSCNSNLSVTA